MTYITRDMINRTCRRRYKEIETPSWLSEMLDLEGTWRIQSLTERERNRVDLQLFGDGEKVDRSEQVLHKARWVAASLVDDEGNRLYSDDEAGQVADLDSALIDWLFECVSKHCGVSGKDLEELEKNSEPTETSDCLLSV